MDCTFSRERLARLAEIEQWHFWFVGRRALIDRLLARYLPPAGQSLLDVGCGTGRMLEILAGRGYRVAGVDQRPEGLAVVRQALPEAQLEQASAAALPLPPAAFDGVLLLDVLEHVVPGPVLAEIHRVLKPGGYAIITVPAMPWLWSYRDEAAGHRCRYTRRGLQETLKRGLFEVETIQYYQCLLFPVVVLARLLGRTGPVTRDQEERPLPMLNAIMTRINLLEVRLGKRVRWPWGSSLAAVCRKSSA